MNTDTAWAAYRHSCLTAVPTLLASLAGAAPAAQGAGAVQPSVTISGLLTREGAECQALRADNGELFTLVGDLKGFAPGQRVRVSGQRLEVSTCQQGTTVRVRKIVSTR